MLLTEKIGLFGAISALIETTVGAIVHTLRIPLRGMMLSYVQIFTLILFGKRLQSYSQSESRLQEFQKYSGEGLLSISFIAASLKSFSPSGAKLGPMFYIFMQGLFFTLPVRILGWHFLSTLLGAIALALFNLFGPLFVDYLIFGSSILKAYFKAMEWAGNVVGIKELNFWTFLLAVALLKCVVAFIVVLLASWGKWDHVIDEKELQLKEFSQSQSPFATNDSHHDFYFPGRGASWKNSFQRARSDLWQKKVLIPFIIITFFISLFAELKGPELVLVILRAITFTWAGFVLSHRINLKKIILFLHQHQMQKLALSLESAFTYVSFFLRSKIKK